MTNIVRFPSGTFPAFPSLELSYPDRWTPLNALGTTMAFGADVEPGQFRPNVVVVVSRFEAGYQLATAIDAVVKKFEGLDGIVEIGREETIITGCPGFRMEVSYSDVRVGTLAQAVRLVIVDQGPVVDLIQITGSCTGSQAEMYFEEIRDIQDSLTRI